MRTSARRAIVLVRQRMRHLPARAQPLARELLEDEPRLLAIVAEVLEVRTGVRIRAHGDLHLGQVLFTGRDYVFVDFEGEPARSFGERRLKRSPLADVAGMLRSYHYAAHTAVDELVSRGVLDDEEGAGTEVAQYRDAAERWAFWTAVSFLQGYLPVAASAGLLPESTPELAVSVRAHLLDKACYELRYEIGNRPDWVHLPLLGILSLLPPAERAAS
jgi:maltose alpha-D-glucosyltransferase/alpha-amylase